MIALDRAAQRQLLRLLPSVGRYEAAFEAQNKRLARTTLTGKISSLQNASTLFEFLENTQQNFAGLQGRLIEHLLSESLSKAVLEARSRAQCAIDILIRNLYERTADVGFLATDEDLTAFLSLPSPDADQKALVRERLREYARKYTVYREILLLRPDGRVAARLDAANPATCSRDDLVQAALRSDGYVERFGPCDLLSGDQKALIYAGRMGPKESPLGVLALVFDFEGEMARIFKRLGGLLVLCDEKNRPIAVSHPETVPQGLRLANAKSRGYELLSVAGGVHVAAGAQTKGYEGFYGLGWTAYALTPPDRALGNQNAKAGGYTALLPDTLREIVEQSVEIGEDLGDVVINGELIASKAKAYALNPLLENIRAIGDQIRGIFVQALGDLEQTVAASLFSETALLADLSLDIMDRNLYERANDCRWWALTGRFRSQLAAGVDPEGARALGEVLAYINGLYTVYSLLLLYDTAGTVVAVSKPSAAALIGQKIAGDAVRQTLHNHDPQRYFVSPFEPSPLYGNRPTYLYHASVCDPQNPARTVGGIAIVFDAAPQFEAILRDTLPLGSEGQEIAGAFNLFADEKNRVIASTHPGLKPLDELPFDSAAFKTGEASLFAWDNKNFIAAAARSQGYREYKNGDGYANAVRSLTFVPA